MKKIDFLIRYEVKARELESIMLLKLELERRGYTVGLVGNYEQRFDFEPKVLIVPACYNTGNIMYEICKYKIRKIANLQWEQVFVSHNEDNPESRLNVYGYGRKILHLLWGERSRIRLRNSGQNISHTEITGCVNTDLIRDKFKKLLLTKKELADRYNLDVNKKWCLFVSSFSFCNLSPLQINLVKQELGVDYYNYFKKLSDDSRNSIVQWFQKALNDHPDTIIIYRPHPEEQNDQQLIKMAQDYPNFYVIFDLAMKHWVNACDKIYNWDSTGQVDVMLLRKPYRFLRPIKIKEEFDYKLFIGIDSIKNEQAFLNDFSNMEYKEIIDKNLFDSYYYIPQNYIYQNMCDILEQMLKTDKYDIKLNLKEWMYVEALTCKIRLMDVLKKIIGNALYMRIKHTFKPVTSFEIDYQKTIETCYSRNTATPKEIEEVESRLKPLIYEQ